MMRSTPFGSGVPRPKATGPRLKYYLPANDVLPRPFVFIAKKLLKALLTLHRVEAPRTHDLRRLIQLATPSAPQLGSFADRCDDLSVHGVQSRYPDDWVEITAAEMNQVVELARELKPVLMSELDEGLG